MSMYDYVCKKCGTKQEGGPSKRYCEKCHGRLDRAAEAQEQVAAPEPASVNGTGDIDDALKALALLKDLGRERFIAACENAIRLMDVVAP